MVYLACFVRFSITKGFILFTLCECIFLVLEIYTPRPLFQESIGVIFHFYFHFTFNSVLHLIPFLILFHFTFHSFFPLRKFSLNAMKWNRSSCARSWMLYCLIYFIPFWMYVLVIEGWYLALCECFCGQMFW